MGTMTVAMTPIIATTTPIATQFKGEFTPIADMVAPMLLGDDSLHIHLVKPLPSGAGVVRAPTFDSSAGPGVVYKEGLDQVQGRCKPPSTPSQFQLGFALLMAEQQHVTLYA
jgi:hypothetical protein